MCACIELSFHCQKMPLFLYSIVESRLPNPCFRHSPSHMQWGTKNVFFQKQKKIFAVSIPEIQYPESYRNVKPNTMSFF